MKKPESSRGRFSIGSILSLSALILGIACVGWALISIRAQSVDSEEAFLNQVSGLTPSTANQAGTVGSEAAVLYPVQPAAGDMIGSLTIPVLKEKIPLVEGTGAEELKKGAGHFAQSVLPGIADNCVLSGHRDTVFADIGKLKTGDQLIVETSAGSFTYEVSGTRIVDKDDRTVIVPTDHAVLTLTTCYPFSFFGHAPDRYIVTADLAVSE